MKERTTIAFLMISIYFYSFNLLAQPCPGITFTTQAQIDNFQVNYPGCTEISGSVEINGDNISNLNGLNVLTSIGGHLEIGDVLTLYFANPFLGSVTGLENLTSIGGDLYIGWNTSLTSITGLENLTSIGGDLSIFGNDNLSSITGLGSLTSIGGNLSIEFNNPLTSLTVLNNVTSIGGGLDINGNAALTSLEGLENLTSIGDHLTIWNNDALTGLSSLQNLTSIDGNINISDNYTLESINGLDNIESASIININIENNHSLSSCHVQSICDYLVSPIGTFNISNNAAGCNSPEEVLEACETVSIADITLTEPFTITPNPISSTSIIEYFLTQSSPVTIQIIDVSGQVIKQLLYEQQHQGEQRIVFDGTVFKSGAYFVVMKTNQGIQTTKLLKL